MHERGIKLHKVTSKPGHDHGTTVERAETKTEQDKLKKHAAAGPYCNKSCSTLYYEKATAFKIVLRENSCFCKKKLRVLHVWLAFYFFTAGTFQKHNQAHSKSKMEFMPIDEVKMHRDKTIIIK